MLLLKEFEKRENLLVAKVEGKQQEKLDMQAKVGDNGELMQAKVGDNGEVMQAKVGDNGELIPFLS